MKQIPKDTESEVQARFLEIAQRDHQTALRLLMLRDMIFHRNLSVKALAEVAECSAEWLYSLIRGTAWYRMSLPKLDAWMDKLDSAITVLTDAKGGVYSACECNPTSIEAIREVLFHAALT